MRNITVNQSESRIELRFAPFSFEFKDLLKNALASCSPRFVKADGDNFWWVKLSPKAVQICLEFGEAQGFDGLQSLRDLDESKLKQAEEVEKLELSEKIDQTQKLRETCESLARINQELRNKNSFLLTMFTQEQMEEYAKYLNGEIVEVVVEKPKQEYKPVYRFIDEVQVLEDF